MTTNFGISIDSSNINSIPVTKHDLLPVADLRGVPAFPSPSIITGPWSEAIFHPVKTKEYEIGSKRVNPNRPLVAVVMGSNSDLEVMKHAITILNELGIPYKVAVTSAHRTPGRVEQFARGAEAEGFEVIIAGAGGAAHLPGMVAAQTNLPVLGVPVATTESMLRGQDALLSIVQMPGGVPVGTMAIGKAGATNAGVMAARMLARSYPEIREKLDLYIAKLERDAANAELRGVAPANLWHPEPTDDLSSILGKPYEGKVRKCFDLKNGYMAIQATPQISAYDFVIENIPGKGEILTKFCEYWFTEIEKSGICKTHFVCNPDPSVMICKKLEMINIEVVVRAYLTGSGWEEYQEKGSVCGVPLPAGLKDGDKLPHLIITPTTKEREKGKHDAAITEEQILARGIVKPEVWKIVKEKALALFKFGSEKLSESGLILVDTKFEFGLDSAGNVILADEVFTPDSSRIWRFYEGIKEILDKQVFRDWLKAKGFTGKLGQVPPVLTPDDIKFFARHYEKALKLICGGHIVPSSEDPNGRMKRRLTSWFEVNPRYAPQLGI